MWTSFDTVPVDAPPYTIGASAGVNVSVSPSSAGSLATYVISDLHASAAMSAGSSAISLDAPTGTTFPSSPAEYSVQDSTTPSGSGTVTAAVTGGGTNDVTFKVPGDISAGDGLTVTILDVINPSTASSTYTIGLTGTVSGPSTTAAPFPHAVVTYPNGAIIKFSGQDYVLAGGHAFEVTSPKILAALQKVDHATVVPAASGAKPPSGAPRQGTLLFTRPVNGAATIYVVGTDGELHGFVSPTQFKHDGYDPALVVTVPSLSGLKVGRSVGAMGAAGNAFGTSSDGAIIDSSGKYYVFAGGRAFLIPSSAELTSLRKSRQGSGAFRPSDDGATRRGHCQRRGAERSGTGLRDVPGEPVPVQVAIAAAHGRLRRYSGGTGPRRGRPARSLPVIQVHSGRCPAPAIQGRSRSGVPATTGCNAGAVITDIRVPAGAEVPEVAVIVCGEARNPLR